MTFLTTGVGGCSGQHHDPRAPTRTSCSRTKLRCSACRLCAESDRSRWPSQQRSPVSRNYSTPTRMTLARSWSLYIRLRHTRARRGLRARFASPREQATSWAAAGTPTQRLLQPVNNLPRAGGRLHGKTLDCVQGVGGACNAAPTIVPLARCISFTPKHHTSAVTKATSRVSSFDRPQS
jgi:hypothetical protein